MSLTYKAVGWNRQKKIYDRLLFGGIGLYLATFVAVGLLLRPAVTAETLLIRALGTAALLLLHLVLVIGPLARLDPRFLPFLYNRRHLGVATFLLGLAHGAFALVQFHALGDSNPLVSVLSANTRIGSLSHFPFQPLGLLALLILFLMAATSHDFWLAQLSAPWWKRLHMAAYLAYALLVAHVALGVLQAETHPVLALTLVAGVAVVVGLHLTAGWRGRAQDATRQGETKDGYLQVCAVADIKPGRAHITTIGGERVAIFHYDGKISALSNVCQHQNGPLGEGRVINGCVVCPWHGYEYAADSGASPPPFNEQVPTFNVRVSDGQVWVDPKPNPAGTHVQPATTADPSLTAAMPAEPGSELYIGYQERAPAAVARSTRKLVVATATAATAIATLLVALQASFANSNFAYGTIESFEGQLLAAPYPLLTISAPEDWAGRTAILVGLGKHGADQQTQGLGGRAVRLRGQRIYRGEQLMIELTADPVENLGAARAPTPLESSFGEQRLTGEIVDSKCHLGVMKPGNGKPHRGCAVRCISGGSPPMLWVRDRAGGDRLLLLTGRDGRQLGSEILDRVAEPVVISGELLRRGALWILRTEPAAIVRVQQDAA